MRNVPIFALLALASVGCSVERFVNRLTGASAPAVSERARGLHGSSLVVDLHADSLLWDRDLVARSSVGHVDLRRLQEGGVGLQVFAAVTRVPMDINIERTHAWLPDLITLLAWIDGWPSAARASLHQRALYQAKKLERFAAGSAGALRLVKTRGDLERLLEARGEDPRIVGALLAIEGVHALDADLTNLDALDRAGFRMIGLTHFFDNEFSGSAHGTEKGGLTDLGRALVRELEARKILVDLAHASRRAIDDVLAIATRPVVVSHTGVKGTCNNVRNLSDEHLRAIAGTGGVIGVGFWKTAVCGETAADVARAMRYVAERAGDDHIALGSDFDGAVATPFDAAGLPVLTEALLGAGFTDDVIRKILGGNALRVLRSALPD